MTTQGAALYGAVKEARKVFVEIANMLKDCDKLMSEHGWEPIGTGSVSGGSVSISLPEKWIPYAINRIYSNAEMLHVTKVIAVVLDDEWGDRIDQPVVVGSKYSTVHERHTNFIGWDHTWWWLKYTDAVPDGVVKPVTEEARKTKEFARFSDLRLRGYPLADIGNTANVNDWIVRPLVEL